MAKPMGTFTSSWMKGCSPVSEMVTKTMEGELTDEILIPAVGDEYFLLYNPAKKW